MPDCPECDSIIPPADLENHLRWHRKEERDEIERAKHPKKVKIKRPKINKNDKDNRFLK